MNSETVGLTLVKSTFERFTEAVEGGSKIADVFRKLD